MKRDTSTVAVAAVDQAVSSASNLALPLLAARVATPAEFGVLSACMVAITSVLAVTRVSLGNSIGFSAQQGVNSVREVTGRVSAVLIVGSPFMLLLIVAFGFVSGGAEVPRVVAMLSAITPIVVLQDVLRVQAVAGGEAWRALLGDLLWLLVVLAVALAYAARGGNPSVTGIVGAWAAGALVSWVYLRSSAGIRARWTGTRTWARGQRRHLLHSGGGAALNSGSSLGRVGLIGALSGPSTVGLLAAGQLLMTPLNFIAALLPYVASPLVAKYRPPRSALGPYVAIALTSLVAGLVWWAICTVTPGSVGYALLGDLWPDARALVPAMAVMSIAILLTTGARQYLLYLGAARSYSVSVGVVALLSPLATLVVLWLRDDLFALAWANSAVIVLGTVLSWCFVLRTWRSVRASGVNSDEPVDGVA